MTKPMTKEDATQFFAELFGGEHHIPGMTKGVKPFGQGWCVNTWQDFATFDGNLLTELVFLAHDKAVRVEIQNGGPKRVKIIIHQRAREGRLYDRHPTLEEAVAEWRSHRIEEVFVKQLRAGKGIRITKEIEVEIQLNDVSTADLLQELGARMGGEHLVIPFILKALRHHNCPEHIILEIGDWNKEPVVNTERLKQWKATCEKGAK